MTKTPPAAPALDRGLRLLELIQARQSVSFGAIASAMGLSHTAVSRLLRVLVERGYACKHPDHGRYEPGPRLMFMAKGLSSSQGLKAAAQGALATLSDTTQCTALLLGWNGQVSVCLDKHMRPDSVVGQEVGRINDDLSLDPWGWMFTHEAQMTRRRSRDEVQAVTRYARLGYIVDHGDVYPGVCRVAAPIVSESSAAVMGALAVIGTSTTLSRAKADRAGRKLVALAQQVAQASGGL